MDNELFFDYRRRLEGSTDIEKREICEEIFDYCIFDSQNCSVDEIHKYGEMLKKFGFERYSSLLLGINSLDDTLMLAADFAAGAVRSSIEKKQVFSNTIDDIFN